MMWCVKNLIYFCQTEVGSAAHLPHVLPLPLCVTEMPLWFVFSSQPFFCEAFLKKKKKKFPLCYGLLFC